MERKPLSYTSLEFLHKPVWYPQVPSSDPNMNPGGYRSMKISSTCNKKPMAMRKALIPGSELRSMAWIVDLHTFQPGLF